ncbi:hypothetical protein BJ508DRAFT_315267 [Ascobolus immersus RN42]|uniref:Uncharacterized protein n=1 Tax=Ascobolus immersus RN42 TaxID=1160509 RepID=A0A3N4HHQ9_ASCIM|nr:hypothetical protein BJ508DRAFT_315267 [Ascobolus immersus RN42]
MSYNAYNYLWFDPPRSEFDIIEKPSEILARVYEDGICCDIRTCCWSAIDTITTWSFYDIILAWRYPDAQHSTYCCHYSSKDPPVYLPLREPLDYHIDNHFHDLRALAEPTRRWHNQLAKYGMKHTWRHIQPEYHPTPESRNEARLFRLIHARISNNKYGMNHPPKGYWRFSPEQQIRQYGIDRKVLRLYPEGQAKWGFLLECRRGSKIWRCRDGYCCMRWKVARSGIKGRRERKREGCEQALEYANNEVGSDKDLAFEGEVLEDGLDEVVDEKVIWPWRSWEMTVMNAKVSTCSINITPSRQAPRKSVPRPFINSSAD